MEDYKKSNDLSELLGNPDLKGLKEKFPTLDEITILRWLISKKGDPSATEKALEAHMKWRADVRYDEVTLPFDKSTVHAFSSTPGARAIGRFCPASPFYSKDLLGNPVSVVLWGNINTTSLMGNVSQTRFARFELILMHLSLKLLNDQSRADGVLRRCLAVVDLEGVGTAHVASDFLEYLKPLYAQAQDHFPEMVHKIVFIKKSPSFGVGWALMAPLLSEGTQAKCESFGWEYTSDLEKFIAKSQIPEFLKGDNYAPCIPNYEEGFEVEFVDPRKKHEKLIPVTSGDVVHWEFRTADNDIKFGVFFLPSTGGDDADTSAQETVLEVARVSSQKVLQRGKFAATKAGKVKLLWDNSYSLMTSKSIIFKIQTFSKEAAAKLLEEDIEDEKE